MISQKAREKNEFLKLREKDRENRTNHIQNIRKRIILDLPKQHQKLEASVPRWPSKIPASGSLLPCIQSPPKQSKACGWDMAEVVCYSAAQPYKTLHPKV